MCRKNEYQIIELINKLKPHSYLLMTYIKALDDVADQLEDLPGCETTALDLEEVIKSLKWELGHRIYRVYKEKVDEEEFPSGDYDEDSGDSTEES